MHIINVRVSLEDYAVALIASMRPEGLDDEAMYAEEPVLVRRPDESIRQMKDLFSKIGEAISRQTGKDWYLRIDPTAEVEQGISPVCLDRAGMEQGYVYIPIRDCLGPTAGFLKGYRYDVQAVPIWCQVEFDHELLTGGLLDGHIQLEEMCVRGADICFRWLGKDGRALERFPVRDM